MNKITKRLLGGLMAAALTVCGCGSASAKETYGYGENTSVYYSSNISKNRQKNAKEEAMWEVLPEIETTLKSEFEYEYCRTVGGIVVTGYFGESLEIRIPDEFDGKPVVWINLKSCEKKLTEVIMPDTVRGFDFSQTAIKSIKYINHPKDIEAVSFSGMSTDVYDNLLAVYIPDNVTTIGWLSFLDFPSLKSVSIPDSVYQISDYAFAGCTNIRNITIPDSVTKISVHAFDGCENIKALYKNKNYDYEHIDDLYSAINSK